MPSWGIHLKIANLLSEKFLNINKNQFMIANLLPDVNNGYVIKEISRKVNHDVTHYEKFKNLKNYEAFYNTHKKELKNPIVIGYLTHLMTDFYFNDLTYSKKGMHDNLGNFIGIKLNNGEIRICEQEDARKLKTNDFRIFANYIYENDKIEQLYYDNKIITYNYLIKEINITKEDIINTIEYINLHIQGKQKILREYDCEKYIIQKILNEYNYKEYMIFNEEELKKHINLCIDFIIKYLNTK